MRRWKSRLEVSADHPGLWDAVHTYLAEKSLEKQREVEKLCAQALARDEFVREYIQQRFTLVWAAGEMPVVLFKKLGLWSRVWLAWKLLWTGEG